jgi:hypothetical protein
LEQEIPGASQRSGKAFDGKIKNLCGFSIGETLAINQGDNLASGLRELD